MDPDRRASIRGRIGPLIETVRVVPDLATFAVDDGFAYAVPDELGPVDVGRIVRVPLGGRTVRGFVTDRGDVAGNHQLKPLASVSGDLPVFSEALLATARWVATHYVAPLSVILNRCAPPNLPRTVEPDSYIEISLMPPATPDGESAAQFASLLISGRRPRPQYFVAGHGVDDLIATMAAPLLDVEQSLMVVGPTVAEVLRMGNELTKRFGNRVVVATSALSAAEQTRTWARAALQPGRLLVGTREIALWPVAAIAAAIVVGEGRRAMKAPQTPTVHVREILRRRAAIERFGLAMIGAVPSTEALAAGVEVHQPTGRVWPLVEVADRRDEPPGGGIVMERTRAAIGGIVRRGGRVFVLVHRRGYAPAFRCVRCRQVRRCTVCDSMVDRTERCRRCGTVHEACATCGGRRFEPLGAGIGRVVDDLRRSLGAAVGPADADHRVLVGTERDLVELEPVDLAVSVDVDALVLAPNYRAPEEALRLLARLALAVRPGRGRRCLLQTTLPDQRVVAALRSGRPLAHQRSVLEERERTGFPPVGEMIAVVVSGLDDPIDIAAVAPGATVLGPATSPAGRRWLIQGPDLREDRIRLRGFVQALRDRGAAVRVDVDPLDL